MTLSRAFFLRVAVGDSIQQESPETWLITRPGELAVRGLGEFGFVHRDEAGRMELRFPVDRDSVSSTLGAKPVSGPCSFCGVWEVEYSW